MPTARRYHEQPISGRGEGEAMQHSARLQFHNQEQIQRGWMIASIFSIISYSVLRHRHRIDDLRQSGFLNLKAVSNRFVVIGLR